MKSKLFRSACEAAASCLGPAMQWTLYYGEPCDRIGLMNFAACLDKESPLSSDNSFYVACEDGSLGITHDKGEHVFHLATVVAPEPEEALQPIAETPGMVIKDEVQNKLNSLRKMLTIKGLLTKIIVTVLSMAVLWIGTMLWQRVCANNGEGSPLIAKIIAYLTFADGGVSRNYFYILGGMLGKTFVMTTVMAFVLGGFKKVGKGAKSFAYRSLRINSAKTLSLYLAGMGVACVLYNFFVGKAELRLTMVGIAGVLSMLWAIGGGVHFIRRMTVALTAHINQQTKIHYQNMERAMHVLSGMAYGFLLSIGLSAADGFAPYEVGFFLIIVAAVMLLIISQKNNGSNTVGRAAVVLALLALPLGTMARDWQLDFVRMEYGRSKHTNTAIKQPGVHEDTWGNVFSCSEPPKVIKKGDKVTLRVSSNLNGGYLYFGYPSGEEDISTMNCIDFFEAGLAVGDDKREYTYNFTAKSLMANSVKMEEAEDGTEFAIIFQASHAETRWIYRYTSTGKSGVFGGGGSPGKNPYSKLSDLQMAMSMTATVIALIMGLVLAGYNGGMGGGPNVPSRPSDPYVRRQPDGTIEYINPITKERDYLPADEDEEAIREQVETVLRNRDYYERSNNLHNQWKQQTHNDLQQEIQRRNQQYEDYLKRKEQLRLAQEKQDAYIDKLKDERGIYDSDMLKRELMKERGMSEAEYWQHMAESDIAEGNYNLAKTTKDVADVSMDVLAGLTGPVGGKIRDVYKATAEIAGTMTEAGVRGTSLTKAAAKGILNAAITYAQYQSGGDGNLVHFGTTVMGEGFRDGINALYEGKSGAEAGRNFVSGLGRGFGDYVIDTGVNNVGSLFKYGSADTGNMTERITDAVANLGDDVGKYKFDNAYGGETPSDDPSLWTTLRYTKDRMFK